MSVSRRRRRPASEGAPPEVALTPASAEPPRIHLIAYGPDGVEEHRPRDAAEVEALLGRQPVTWINVVGYVDEAAVRDLGALFGLHSLALEDVVTTDQRSKVEQYDERLYMVVRMVDFSESPMVTEQVSIFLGSDFVLTFQERPGRVFDGVLGRIRRGTGRMRRRGPDYLSYAIIDAVVDNYFPAIEQIGERIRELEDEIFADPTASTVQAIHAAKRDLLTLRKDLWPKREMLRSLYRDPHPLISEETDVFLRDCHDHAIQLIDIVETHRELAASLMDMYLTTISNRMNEIMKVLTMIATIFIPLAFIASVYGMNFDASAGSTNMPELRWRYGYVFCLGLMAAVAGLLLLYFRRKGWLGRGKGRGMDESGER